MPVQTLFTSKPANALLSRPHRTLGGAGRLRGAVRTATSRPIHRPGLASSSPLIRCRHWQLPNSGSSAAGPHRQLSLLTQLSVPRTVSRCWPAPCGAQRSPGCRSHRGAVRTGVPPPRVSATQFVSHRLDQLRSNRYQDRARPWRACLRCRPAAPLQVNRSPSAEQEAYDASSLDW